MFSYEDRLRAVQLYIKLGIRVGLTIRQLGFPTKDTLKHWYQEYEQGPDLATGYTRAPRYSKTQKEFAVAHYLEHGRRFAATIKARGYPSRTLLPFWVQELHPQTSKRVVGRSAALTPAMKLTAVIELCMREGSARSVAEELGVSRPSLYTWKNQLLGNDAPASMNRKQDLQSSLELAELEQQAAALRQEVRRLRLEQDLLKKANELLKKDLGINQQLLTNLEKTQLVDAVRPTYGLDELLRAVGLPRSSYFYHRARLDVADKYVDVRRVMADIFERNYRCYGYRRMQASLTKRSVNISEKVVQRLMKCLVAATPKRRRYGSYMGEISLRRTTSCSATSAQPHRTRSGSPTSRNSRSQRARCICRR